MIGYLSGKIVDITPTSTYIDVNGVGYEVYISLFTYEQIKELKECKLFTQLIIREDAWSMYGFSQLQEKEAFNKLLSVSGVGASTARVMLSTLSTNELYTIIANGDSKLLEKVKGIGAKTAQRIILELKGKLDFTSDVENYNLAPSHNRRIEDALKALVGLGISKVQAEQAIKKMNIDADTPIDQIIKEALKYL